MCILVFLGTSTYLVCFLVVLGTWLGNKAMLDDMTLFAAVNIQSDLDNMAHTPNASSDYLTCKPSKS